MTELNTNSYLVANKTANTFELTDLDGVDIDSSLFTAYISAGEARKFVTTVSGLSHLEGETVTICGDGATQPDRIVASGAITLQYEATTVHVGYGYTATLKMLRLDAGARDGTSFGKTRRTHRVAVMLHRSLGLKLGVDDGSLNEITFRSFGDNQSRAVPLFTGIMTFELDAEYNLDNQLVLVSDQPLPSMILSVMPLLVEQDR